MDEKIVKVKQNLKILNSKYETIESQNEGLIDFVINEVIDRILLYLRRDDLPKNMERIISRVVNTALIKVLKEYEAAEVDKAVTEISDNGQSVSFSNEITKYFSVATDEELFSGVTPILNRYRKIKVVYPETIL